MKRTSRFAIAAVLSIAAASSVSHLRAGPAAGAAPSIVSPDAAASGKPIARIWRGRTLTSRADEYEKYLVGSGIVRIEATPGNLGVTLLRRADGKETEFVVISVWESIEAVKRFAGRDYDKAVISDYDREYLLEVEPTVKHYDIEKEERKR